MGDCVFRFTLVSALTVCLVRQTYELSNCRLKAKIVTKLINAFGYAVLGSLWRFWRLNILYLIIT